MLNYLNNSLRRLYFTTFSLLYFSGEGVNITDAVHMLKSHETARVSFCLSRLCKRNGSYVTKNQSRQ
jgi:hypothetical protein